MSKRPEIIALANKGSIAFLEKLQNLSHQFDSEMCLAVSPTELSEDPNLGTPSPKAACVTCQMLDTCVANAGQTKNPLESKSHLKKSLASEHGLKDSDVGRLVSEMNYILYSPASEVSSHFNVESRTVVRWRATIRASLDNKKP